MRPTLVVIGNPGRDGRSGVIEAEEQRLVQELVAHAPVEALADAVLHRLAGRDEVCQAIQFSLVQPSMAFEVNSES